MRVMVRILLTHECFERAGAASSSVGTDRADARRIAEKAERHTRSRPLRAVAVAAAARGVGARGSPDGDCAVREHAQRTRLTQTTTMTSKRTTAHKRRGEEANETAAYNRSSRAAPGCCCGTSPEQRGASNHHRDQPRPPPQAFFYSLSLIPTHHLARGSRALAWTDLLKEQPHDTDELRARRRPQRQWGRAEIEPPQRTPSRAAVAAATALLPAAPPAVPSHGRTIDVALITARAVLVASAAFIATAIVLAISKVITKVVSSFFDG